MPLWALSARLVAFELRALCWSAVATKCVSARRARSGRHCGVGPMTRPKVLAVVGQNVPFQTVSDRTRLSTDVRGICSVQAARAPAVSWFHSAPHPVVASDILSWTAIGVWFPPSTTDSRSLTPNLTWARIAIRCCLPSLHGADDFCQGHDRRTASHSKESIHA